MNLHKKISYFLKSKRERSIIDIIDKEVDKTKEFGLYIEEKDIEFEKSVIIPIILYFWKDIQESHGNRYIALGRVVRNRVFEELNNQIEYYYDISKDKSVKNMYNCHVTCVMDRLFLEINNKII